MLQVGKRRPVDCLLRVEHRLFDTLDEPLKACEAGRRQNRSAMFCRNSVRNVSAIALP